MDECGGATTLYGSKLQVEITNGKKRQKASWQEERYDADTDRARHEAQQQWWRRDSDA